MLNAYFLSRDYSISAVADYRSAETFGLVWAAPWWWAGSKENGGHRVIAHMSGTNRAIVQRVVEPKMLLSEIARGYGVFTPADLMFPDIRVSLHVFPV
jgi:hypothetical protein